MPMNPDAMQLDPGATAAPAPGAGALPMGGGGGEEELLMLLMELLGGGAMGGAEGAQLPQQLPVGGL